jgi:hypothetical protein
MHDNTPTTKKKKKRSHTAFAHTRVADQQDLENIVATNEIGEWLARKRRKCDSTQRKKKKKKKDFFQRKTREQQLRSAHKKIRKFSKTY